jgi:predicted HD phosphohydrolase
MGFKALSETVRDDWKKVAVAIKEDHKNLPVKIETILRGFEHLDHGFPCSQLHHALSMATLAKRDGASDELIVAALCHDIGKFFSVANHAAIAAEILRPYVSDNVYRVLYNHQDFQGHYYYENFGMDPDCRDRFKTEPWYQDGLKFSSWDQAAFDADFKPEPLEAFLPLLKKQLEAFPFEVKD